MQDPMNHMTHTCQNCARSQRGFFCEKRLYCYQCDTKEVEPDGTCEDWKDKEENTNGN